MFFAAASLGLAVALVVLESLTPRSVLGYPVLEMDRDPPSVLGPFSPCQAGGTLPCLDPAKECTVVEEDNSVYIGDIAIPKGAWCLPSGRPRACGTLTGKQVWTADGWRCICLYPDVAGGPDCSRRTACDCAGDVDCPNHAVHDSDGSPYTGAGNPYADGVRCECAEPLDDEKMRLADPLRCHRDPCTPDGRAKVFKDGRCDCERMNWIESNVNFKCHRPPENCLWDYERKECRCGQGLTPVHCQSNLFKRPDHITERCDGNGGGCVCKAVCAAGQCLNGSIPKVVELKPGLFECECVCINSEPVCSRGERCETRCLVSGSTWVEDGWPRQCCFGGGVTCIEHPFSDYCLRYVNNCWEEKCPSW